MSTRVALVTGANRGIGAELAEQLHTQGWTVLLGVRDLAKGRETAEAISAGSERLLPVKLDVSDPDDAASAAEWAAKKVEQVDAVINNAAILYDPAERAISVDLGSVHRAMETNLYGAWRVCQAFQPLLRRSAHPRIVNVSSEGGSISEMTGGAPAYNVSKAALNALTRLLAGELRRDRILVNAICPGWTDTDMGQGGRPVRDGARSVLWAVNLRDDGPTGGFFRDGRPLPW
ncbi:SDR family NAD(P)-dependent oxidoreductase [Kribbella sp. NPDC051620]|uniref:SDR family NAD(P)-dependent oxidoreductase n=1 Tax=Kribbella sp. NPDC051620 TaxID=3364120 RepID=UPI0037BD3894